MIEARTQDIKSLIILYMKETDYVMNIMASWMTLDKLESARTRRDLIYISGTKDTKQCIYRKPFGLHFGYIHQVYDHNNCRNAPIHLERTWTTKFWPDKKFAWYIDVSEVNTALASYHFQSDGVVQPSLYFWRALET